MTRRLLLTASLLAVAALALGGDSASAGTTVPAERLAEYADRLGGGFRQTFEAASKISAKSGIGEYEAYVLSAAYLYAHVELCSTIHGLKDAGDRWVAETRVSEPPGDVGPPIYVEKATGVTHSPQNKRVTDPKSYLETNI